MGRISLAVLLVLSLFGYMYFAAYHAVTDGFPEEEPKESVFFYMRLGHYNPETGESRWGSKEPLTRDPFGAFEGRDVPKPVGDYIQFGLYNLTTKEIDWEPRITTLPELDQAYYNYRTDRLEWTRYQPAMESAR